MRNGHGARERERAQPRGAGHGQRARARAVRREPRAPAGEHRARPQRDRATGHGGAMRTSRPTATGPDGKWDAQWDCMANGSRNGTGSWGAGERARPRGTAARVGSPDGRASRATATDRMANSPRNGTVQWEQRRDDNATRGDEAREEWVDKGVKEEVLRR